MKVIVVYESHWGNTASVAKAIAEGFDQRHKCHDRRGLAWSRRGCRSDHRRGTGHGLSLPSDRMLATMPATRGAVSARHVPPRCVRGWTVCRRAWTFGPVRDRLRWSPGGATGAIVHKLEKAGFRRLGKSRRFVVAGSYGPLREGELSRARQWGSELAGAMSA
jgi:hypothetical protein